MSDKKFSELCYVDRTVRKAFGLIGMQDGVKLKIELICGFELFNTRPYHNYETWSDGWRITEGDKEYSAEDLDDAINKWISGRTKEGL